MQAIVTDMTHNVSADLCVSLSVCVGHNPELEMPFDMLTHVSQRSCVVGGCRLSPPSEWYMRDSDASYHYSYYGNLLPLYYSCGEDSDRIPFMLVTCMHDVSVVQVRHQL